jgi:DNA replication protein DnaC
MARRSAPTGWPWTGDSGTGKTHLLIGLGLAACEQGRRVRCITTAQLVNELIEAADDRALSRVVGRCAKNPA